MERISLNEHPAMSRKEFDQGTMCTDSSLAERWRSSLATEDLCSFNFLTTLLKETGYMVVTMKKEELDLRATGPCHLQFSGITHKGKGELFCQSGDIFDVDIDCAGAVGITVLQGEEHIDTMAIKGRGHFQPSQGFPGFYTLRLDPEKETVDMPQSRVVTWSQLYRQNIFPREGKIALYSAGGATRSFLQKVPRHIRWDCIIDSFPIENFFCSLPVVTPQEAVIRNLDFILIPSLAFYNDIQANLTHHGFREKEHFLPVCFPDQDI